VSFAGLAEPGLFASNSFQKGLGLWDRDPPGTMPSWGLRNIAFVGLLFACIAVAFANPDESAAGTIVILVASGVMGGGVAAFLLIYGYPLLDRLRRDIQG
jgi:drug/metabolite transporter (DMT)-like permease